MLCWKCHLSSSSLCRPQSSPIPQSCKGYQTLNSLYSRWCRIRRSRLPSAAKHLTSRRTPNSDPLRASTVYRRRPGPRRGAVLRRQITVLSSKAAVAAKSSQLHVSSLYRTELPQCHDMADKNPSVAHSFAAGIMSQQ